MSEQYDKKAFLDSLIASSCHNPEFRSELIKNPKKVLESLIRIQLPDHFEIVVHEDTPSKLNFVLPLKSDELSEIELYAVSGGFSWMDDCIMDCSMDGVRTVVV